MDSIGASTKLEQYLEKKSLLLCAEAQVPPILVDLECIEYNSSLAGGFGGNKKNPECVIGYNMPLLSMVSMEDVRLTIVHEVSHYVSYVRNGYEYYEDSHGAEWVSIMKELGATSWNEYHYFERINNGYTS